MASSNNHETISRASLHTQKKFELIEKYIMPWAQKLMNNPSCKGLVYIDCMCNSGLYHDDNNVLIEGTPLRVSRILRNMLVSILSSRYICILTTRMRLRLLC